MEFGHPEAYKISQLHNNISAKILTGLFVHLESIDYDGDLAPGGNGQCFWASAAAS